MRRVGGRFNMKKMLFRIPAYKLIPVLLALVITQACKKERVTDPIPADLTTIESLAEDAFDSAIVGNFTAVQGQADKIATTWARFRPQASSDGVAEATLQELDTAIQELGASVATANLSSVDLGRAANRVSAPMDLIYEVYGPIVPSAVLKLDYLGREVRLDSMGTNFAEASTHVNSIASAWQGLRTRVVDAGGQSAAQDMDTSINEERAAITTSNAVDLDAAATNQLEVVDAIERVFTKAAADPAD